MIKKNPLLGFFLWIIKMFIYHTLKSLTEIASFKNNHSVYSYLQIYLLESIFYKI